MPVSPARAAAFEILLRIESTHAYASELLHSPRSAKLSRADHALLTELVMGVLRWRALLDERVAEHSSQSLAKLDVEVMTALRLGAYQLLFLDRIPRHAAINESVELVKSARKRSAAGMVNAVLRKITRATSNPDVLSSHPKWLVERWARIYGPDAARKICEYDQVSPKPTVRVSSPETNVGTAALGCPPGRRPGSLAAEQGNELRLTGQPRAAVPTLSLEELHTEGIQLEPGKLLSNTFSLRAGDITATRAFRELRVVIQDEGSQLIAVLVGSGESILDCCAAPGGKTRIIAERNPESTVLALELHPHRAALLRKLVPVGNVQIIAADARQMPFNKPFDRILVDAPCTGTGTLARNPEIKWRLQPEDILRLQAYQTELLLAAMKQVAPGGRIIYSTCSLEPEENSDVVEKALAADPSFRVVDARGELQRLRTTGELKWDDIDSLLSGPYLRTIPGVHPCDGFFAAILEKG
jgi:16S rRNA (cytosine967-C5)-methyltransferase